MSALSLLDKYTKPALPENLDLYKEAFELIDLISQQHLNDAHIKTISAGASMQLVTTLAVTENGLKFVETTPLTFATLYGDPEQVRILLKDPQADPHTGNSKDTLSAGATPYVIAKKLGMTKIVTYFERHTPHPHEHSGLSGLFHRLFN